LTVSREEVEAANATAVERMMDSEPTWVDIAPAKDKIQALKGKTLLHAGPPISWKDASGPLRGAIVGACIYEGWAENEQEAAKLAEEGEVHLDPDHHHDAVGPMAGVISPSMPVYELEDRKFGSKTYSNMNEGVGKVLRYGAFSKDVLDKLRWMAETVAPVLRATVNDMKSTGGLALKPMIAQALTMGDDCHNRYVATTSLFAKQIAPHIVRTGYDAETISQVSRFIDENNFTMLNMGMAAAKAMTMAGQGVKHSTIVTVMSRNGTEAGIWVSSLGKRWFTARAPVPKGLWFPGYTEADANPDIGDSSITETAGFGGFAMATAPAIVSWVGGSVQAAMEVTNRMYEITQAQHKHFLIPFLDFKGTPVGIDLRRVLKTGIAPTINTGIAHRKAGIGQVGAGTITFPMQVFRDAFEAYVDEYGA
jgi:hypothetical protein